MTARMPLDDYLAHLTEGVAALEGLVRTRRGRGDVAAAEAAWRTFLALVRGRGARATPLRDVVARCGLDDSALQLLLLGLTAHLGPTRIEGGPRAAPSIGEAIEALAATPEERRAGREAVADEAPLVRYALLALDGEPATGPMLDRPLALSVMAARYLLGEPGVSPRIAGFVRLVRPRVLLQDVILDPTHVERARVLVSSHDAYREIVRGPDFDGRLPSGGGLVLLFSGPAGTGKSLLAEGLASSAGRPLLEVDSAGLPEGERLDTLLGEVFGEAVVRDAIVSLDDCEALLGKAVRTAGTVMRALQDFDGVAILQTPDAARLHPSVERLATLAVRFALPSAKERLQIFEAHLPPSVPVARGVDLGTLADTYDFSGAAIRNAVSFAVSRAIADGRDGFVLDMAHLEEGCETQLGQMLDQLAVRTTPHLTLDDVVLTDDARRQLEEIIAAIRCRTIVMERWGFDKRLVTGKGITVLFDGPPGTGKTLCAEIIAGEFGRPIYRVDIPEVVSKWVGETEKNIKAVFQNARVSKAMLLFDEADSLFGSRTAEVNSAMDRFANMEVNLILQEIERFPGVCILTTNFIGALDDALRRRIQFRVQFKEPDAGQRARVWRVLAPGDAPLAPDVDFETLGREYEIPGGLIKNAFLRAAYRAAEAGSAITQRLLREACRDECVAAGKVTRDIEAREPPPARSTAPAPPSRLAAAARPPSSPS